MGTARGSFQTSVKDNNAVYHCNDYKKVGTQDGVGFGADKSNKVYGKSTTVQVSSFRLLTIVRT